MDVTRQAEALCLFIEEYFLENKHNIPLFRCIKIDQDTIIVEECEDNGKIDAEFPTPEFEETMALFTKQLIQRATPFVIKVKYKDNTTGVIGFRLIHKIDAIFNKINDLIKIESKIDKCMLALVNLSMNPVLIDPRANCVIKNRLLPLAKKLSGNNSYALVVQMIKKNFEITPWLVGSAPEQDKEVEKLLSYLNN